MEQFVAKLRIKRFQMEDMIDLLLSNGYYVKLHKDYIDVDYADDKVNVYIYEDLTRINKEIKEKAEEK